MPRKKKQETVETESDKVISIRNDLIQQLTEQNKFGSQFKDIVEDYIYFFKLKEKLQEDINKKGIRIKAKTGNGFINEKDNLSVKNLFSTNTQMLKILQDLELKAPDKEKR